MARRKGISLTPLIDVIFLLLLFFMLTSTFSQYASLPLSSSGAGQTAGDRAPLFLRATPEGWTLNGRPVTPEALAPAIAALRTPEPGQPVILAPANGLLAQGLVDALAALTAIGDLSVSVAG
ncbi:ExbD/TolR family protein [Jannaschia sp. 2305UL9-9]|uniref:ExbD/TolR family protein n=1 Tax=Jannaschia sp. 2305UL9-9 TaxID=3121638 RepID=UPI0035294E8D